MRNGIRLFEKILRFFLFEEQSTPVDTCRLATVIKNIGVSLILRSPAPILQRYGQRTSTAEASN